MCPLKVIRDRAAKKEKVFHYLQEQDGQACILSRLFAYSQRYQSISQSVNQSCHIHPSVCPSMLSIPFVPHPLLSLSQHTTSFYHKSYHPSTHSSHILMMQETKPTILIPS